MVNEIGIKVVFRHLYLQDIEVIVTGNDHPYAVFQKCIKHQFGFREEIRLASICVNTDVAGLFRYMCVAILPREQCQSCGMNIPNALKQMLSFLIPYCVDHSFVRL